MAMKAEKTVKKVKKPIKKSAAKKHSATAFHATTKDGSSVIGLGNLRVVLLQEDGVWIAQGLEIDYLAQGSSEKDVKKQFEQGLAATIHAHLYKFGNIDNLLHAAPPEVWKEMLYDKKASLAARYSQLSIHRDTAKAKVKPSLPKEASRLPFDKIQYLEPELVAA